MVKRCFKMTGVGDEGEEEDEEAGLYIVGSGNRDGRAYTLASAPCLMSVPCLSKDVLAAILDISRGKIVAEGLRTIKISPDRERY